MSNVRPFSISVPIGAYHELLAACLASLAQQREFVNVSLLDASGDDRVRRLADQFADLFAYRRHGKDAGQSDAIIEGWRNAPGQILGWLNADDFLYPDALAKVWARFRGDPEIDVVSGHSAICDRKGAMTGYHWAVAPAGDSLRQGCCISQPSCFFSREACEKAGGLDQTLHYTMDWDLWLRLLDSGAKFSFLDEPLSVVYWGEGTKTSGFNAKRRSELERLISRHVRPNDRMRVRRGFALRAALDSIEHAPVKRFLERSLRRNTPYVYGLGPEGVIADEATVCWFHHIEEGCRTLELKIENPSAVDLRCSLPIKSAERRADGFNISFVEPIPTGHIVELRLAKKPGTNSRFLKSNFSYER